MRRWFIRALLVLGAWAGSALAQDVLPVPPLAARVIDQTATLSDPQRAALENKLAALESASGSQLVVLIVPTTQPEDIAAYAQRVGDQWKIGRRDIGDGVLLVVAKSDHKVRIEVAKALEGAIPDLAAKRVIDNQITPAFKAGDFAGGLNAAVDQLAARIKGEALPAPARGAREGAQPGLQWNELMMFFFVGVPVLGAVLSAMLGRKLGSLATSGAAGAVGWWLTASGLLAGGAALLALVLVGVLGVGSSRRGPGGPVFWGGGGGGGFSSGGGGDFGGGGASGSW